MSENEFELFDEAPPWAAEEYELLDEAPPWVSEEYELLDEAPHWVAEEYELFEENETQEKVEKREFEQLVAEMKPLGFTKSKQVSWHIMNNKLGHKYKNISGILKMEKDGTSWNFKGGFPPMIYARLCDELGLSNQNTRARAVGFTPFKDL